MQQHFYEAHETAAKRRCAIIIPTIMVSSLDECQKVLNRLVDSGSSLLLLNKKLRIVMS